MLEEAESAEGVPPHFLAFSIHSSRVSWSTVLSVLSCHTTEKGCSLVGRTEEADGVRGEVLNFGETNKLETTPVHGSSESVGVTATCSPIYDGLAR